MSDPVSSSHAELASTGRNPRRRRWWKWTLLVLFILFGLPTIGFLIWRASVRAEVNEYLAKIGEAGEPVTLEELQAWYPTPEGKNAADVYGQAFALLVEDEQLMENLPGYGVREWPAADEPLPADMADAMRAMLGKNVDALRLVREASAIEGCRFPIDLTQGFDTLFDHTGALRQASRLLEGQAVLHAEAGDGDEAAATVTEMLRVARSLDNEPIVIPFLVQVSLHTMATDAAEQVIGRSRPGGAALAQLQAALEHAANGDARLRRALAGERAQFLAILRGQVPPGAAGSDLPRIPGLIDYDTLHYLRLFDLVMQSVDDPDAADRFSSAYDQVPRFCTLTLILTPTMEIAIETAHRGEAIIRCTATAMAIERYRIDHGKLPSSLTDLTPKYMDELYDDPFNGQNLRFVVKDGAAMVYSVGSDLTDDGGTSRDTDGFKFQPGTDAVVHLRAENDQ